MNQQKPSPIDSGDGLEPIMARQKLNRLHTMADEEIIEIYSVIKRST
jgi:hypothetical protein